MPAGGLPALQGFSGDAPATGVTSAERRIQPWVARLPGRSKASRRPTAAEEGSGHFGLRAHGHLGEERRRWGSSMEVV